MSTALQGMIPLAVKDINRKDFYLMSLGILHQLRWCIKAHGLAIEQGAVKGGGIVAL